MTRTLLPICLILLVLSQLIAAACGGSEGPSARRSTGSLTLFDITPPTLDPALARSSTSLGYIVELFSGLVAFDPDLNLKPEIARSWDLSADGRTQRQLYPSHLRIYPRKSRHIMESKNLGKSLCGIRQNLT